MDGHEELLSQIIELIEEGEYQEAAELATRLQVIGIPDGWHLKSIALLHDGQDDESITVLDEGIARFPDDFGLLLEKASVLMQLERFDEAATVFEQARSMAGDEAGEVDLMEARSEFMQGKVDEALNRLQQIDTPKYILDAFHLQLELLEAVGRTDMILELAEQELEKIGVPSNDDEFETMAGILAKIANAHWEENDDLDTARQLLKLAFHYYRNHQDALWLWREMEPEFDDSAEAFMIEMTGRFLDRDELGDVSGRAYHTQYGVVAKSLDEAMTYVLDFEIDAVDKEAFKVLSVEKEEAEQDEALGIYWAGDMIVLDEDSVSSNGVGH